MNNLMRILIFISIFTILNIFTGTVSATNDIVNQDDNIQSIISNISDNRTILTTEKNITSDQISDELMVNTTGIVMSNYTSNCGPASLATVLHNLSINVSQDVLAAVAGTDENGTTMYGLTQAAQKQGLIVKGLKLKVNELKPWNIVYLIMDNRGHYSIATNITDTTVYLADTDSGNINMTLADFTAAYIQNKTDYGYALVITNDSTNSQLSNNNTLTEEEMKTIKGTGMGWTSSNPLVKALAKTILRNAGYPRSAYDKGRAIWNWVTTHIRYHYHLNTCYSFNFVMIYGWANCCEMARLVVCTARAMGLTARYVYKPQGYYKDYHNGQKKFPGHYWAQIWTGWWQDLDCTLLYDGAQYYGGFMDNYISSYGRVRFNGYKCRQYPSEPT